MIEYPISVFLDTNIFKKSKYNFGDTGPMNLLRNYVSSNKVSLYTSNIALNEVKSNLEKDVVESVRMINQSKRLSRRLLSEFIVSNTRMSDIYEKTADESVVSKTLTKLVNYIDETNTNILDNSGVNLDEVFIKYFEHEPPFENKKDKKNEFPDAIMISKIKDYFDENNPVWVISGDKGFQKGLSGNANIKYFDDIKDLFNMINTNDKWYPKIIKFTSDIDFKELLENSIVAKVIDECVDVDGRDCDRKGYCDGYIYDEATATSINIGKITLNTVDDISDKDITITMNIEADIDVDCYYDDIDNAFWNSEDKEYFGVQRENVLESHQLTFECEVILNIIGKEEQHLEYSSDYHHIQLDEYTRISKDYVVNEQDVSDAKADMMDALEEYHNHK